MKKMFSTACVGAIDIGTTKIGVLVGQPLADGHYEIVGIGHAPSDGLKKGVVVDL